MGQKVNMIQYNLERIQEFKYVGTTVTPDNDITNEIKKSDESPNNISEN